MYLCSERRKKMNETNQLTNRDLFVKLVLRFILLDVVFVALFKIFGQNDVTVLSNGVHAGLLTNGVDVGARDLIGSGHEVFQINFITQVHLGRDGSKDQSLLPAIRQGELDFPIQTTRTQQGRIQRVSSVGGHDDLRKSRTTLNTNRMYLRLKMNDIL